MRGGIDFVGGRLRHVDVSDGGYLRTDFLGFD